MTKQSRVSLMLLATTMSMNLAEAGQIGDRIRSMGDVCRASDGFQQGEEVRGPNPKPYGKPLLEWTRDDVLELREFQARCSIGGYKAWNDYTEQERQDFRKMAMNGPVEIHIQYAREELAKKQAADAALAQRQAAARERDDKIRRDEIAFGEKRQEGIQRATDLLDIMKQFSLRAASLPARSAIEQIDDFSRRAHEFQQDPSTAQLAPELAEASSKLLQLRTSIKQGGPFMDLDELVRGMVYASSNPLLMERFEGSLQRGFDLDAGAINIFKAGPAWMIQLAGKPVPKSETEGLFCRVDVGDQASMNLLGRITPPFTAIRVTGKVGNFDFASMQSFQLVISPCAISAVR